MRSLLVPMVYFSEQPAKLYFQITINTTNTSDYNYNLYYSSFTSKMDGWMDTKTRVQNRLIERQTE